MALLQKGAIVVDCGACAYKAGVVGGAGDCKSTNVRQNVDLAVPCSWSPTPDVVLPSSSSDILCLQRWHRLLGADGKIGRTVERPVVAGLPLATPRHVRGQLVELLFEQFDVMAVCLVSTAFLAVLGVGLSTALVVDVGEAGASAVCVEDGTPAHHCAAYGDIGGMRLTEAMATMVQEAGCELPVDSSWQQVGRLAKEQISYVAEDFAAEQKQPLEMRTFVLPDGKHIQLSRGEASRCGEILFDPRAALSASQPSPSSSSGSKGSPGRETLPELAISALRIQSDVQLRGRLLDNILVVGGSTLMLGLPQRLEAELRKRTTWVAPGRPPEDVHVRAPLDRELLAWRGGATLAECDVMQQLWTTRSEYQEMGCGRRGVATSLGRFV